MGADHESVGEYENAIFPFCPELPVPYINIFAAGEYVANTSSEKEIIKKIPRTDKVANTLMHMCTSLIIENLYILPEGMNH